jgi:hypothetical protein
MLVKNCNSNSKCAQILLENKHEFLPINEIMNVLHVLKKSNHTNTLEKYYIYLETKGEYQINNKCTVSANLLSII